MISVEYAENVVPNLDDYPQRGAYRAMDILPPQIAILSAYEQLSPARRSFADSFVMIGDVRKAYDQVFPHASDYTQALRWIKEPMVQAAIAERMASVADRNSITIERVIQEIGTLAFSNLKNFLEIGSDGLPRWNFEKVTDQQWAAVKEITIDEGTDNNGSPTRKVKIALHDKNSALDKLMKRFGAYAAERVEHVVTGNVNVRQVTVSMSPQEAAQEWQKMLKGE